MRFTLLAIVAIAWSLTVLRWSISRRRSPWHKRAIAVSAIAAVVAIVSVASDLHSIWLPWSATRSDLTITINDMGSWWQVFYRRGKQSFVTANEIHVPARARVEMLWNGPRVTVWGSRDFLPQEAGRFVLVADRRTVEDLRVVAIWPPKVRHLAIVAEDAADFDRWFANEMRPARSDPNTKQLFASAGCAYCHVIRGIAESPWTIAPELTHFGSRQTIAATDLPNRRGYLSGWIVNSAALKRGSQMPESNIEAAVLHQLVSYLGSLR